jgi:hypothetical protein
VTKDYGLDRVDHTLGPDKADEFIAIGHSFGARMLYSATAQTLISQTARAHPGYNGGTYSSVTGDADAVILLNPAFEAARYTALDDFARSARSSLRPGSGRLRGRSAAAILPHA